MTSASPHIGYAAMLERFAPAEVLEFTALAETHGFKGFLTRFDRL